MWGSIIYFLAVSVPEQFLMALFAWLVLGKSETAKFRNVVIVGLSAAVLFSGMRWILGDLLAIIPQIFAFAVLIYFLYRLNVIESVIGCLVTIVVFFVVQGTTVNTVLLLFGWTEKEFSNNQSLAISCAMIYFIVISSISYLIYRSNINVYYLKNKTKDKPYVSRIRFLVLQLTFACLNFFILCTVVLKNMDVFKTASNKALIILCFVINIIFTILVVKSVFKMGDIIQKEEELKRKYDGREIIQNIDYMISLIEANESGELKKTLQSIKDDIDNGIVNDKN